MELLKRLRQTNEDSDHWIDLRPQTLPAELEALDVFRRRLDAALVELGGLGCRLQDATHALRADLTDTHDQLRTGIGQLAQADINQAMRQLVESIRRARELAAAVLPDDEVQR